VAIRLLALDLDGTLLDRTGRIPAAHATAIARARAQGVEAIIVTGRSWRGCQHLHQELGLTTPAITYAGAHLVSPGGEVLWEEALPEPGRSEVLAFLERHPVAATVCVGPDRAYALPGARAWAEEFDPWWEEWNPYTEVRQSLLDLPGEPVMLAVYGRRSVEQLLQRFPTAPAGLLFDVYAPYPETVVCHISTAGVTKGWALARYCAQHGIAPAEVLAAGDQEMDREMLMFAGVGLAMAHAPAHVRAAADLVAAADDPYPVATAIERFVLAAPPSRGAAGGLLSDE
jgi:Cof subfamily protein (haloacid dehalogenase superfamily)